MSSAYARGGSTHCYVHGSRSGCIPTITRQILASLRHVGDNVEVIPHKAEKRWLGVA